jgi:transcriptional regulator with PAS, ATPase and Fis domain
LIKKNKNKQLTRSIKQTTIEIIGNEPKLNRAIEKPFSCPTDISVLVVGESGVEKKVFKIIHSFL